MADNDRIGGVLSFVLGGNQIEIEGSFEVQPFRWQRTSVNGIMGPAGHKRESLIPYFDGTCFYKPALKLETIHGMEGVAAQLNLYNGHSFVLFAAAQVGEIVLDAAEGTFPLRLEGLRCKEV